MRGERKYIFILVGIAILYLVLEITSPKPINWTVTFNEKDKNPFGSFLIKERLPDLFTKVDHSYFTIYELTDSIEGNLFILSEHFNPSQEDTRSLIEFIAAGNNAFIASENFGEKPLLDTLNIKTKNLLFDQNILKAIDLKDTLLVNFANDQLKHEIGFHYQRNDLYNYFEETDSIRTISTTEEGKAILIERKVGEGSLYLCTLPLAFTNNYLLHEENNEFVSKALSHLPNTKLHWTEYYQTGRLESGTPLRYVLSNDSLRITYFVAILSLLLFILFEVKRRQRIIPIMEPLKNTTLEFVSTLGNLYFQNANHKNIAEKRILFFTEKLRANYYIKSTEWTEEFMTEIANRTGNDIKETKALFELISRIKNSSSISENTLNELSKKLDNFKFN